MEIIDWGITNPYMEWERSRQEAELLELECERKDAESRGADQHTMDVIAEHRGMLLRAMGVAVLPVPYYELETA